MDGSPLRGKKCGFPPAALMRALAPLAPCAPVAPGGAAALPALAGAYLLLLRLDRTARTGIATLPDRPLAPGWYVYAGSANGPGGIAARLSRHLRAERKPRWHIDFLNLHAAARCGLALPGGRECDLVAGLIAGGGFSVAVDGFGASDCRACPGHLLRWQPQ